MNLVNDRNRPGGLPALAGAALLAVALHAGAADAWQERLLFDPPLSQLAAEARGRIMIHDGLTDAQFTQAMDEQFERIGSMMFVRTVKNDERGEPLRDASTGAVVVEDDGC
jgi:hypothetical protein